MFDEVSLARFEMWRGELHDIADPASAPAGFARYAEIAARVHRTRVFAADDRTELANIVLVTNMRLRASRAQFMAEFLMFVGDHDEALGYIELGVDAGLQDLLWIERCPLLAPLRSRPELAVLTGRIADRARAELDAIGQPSA